MAAQRIGMVQLVCAEKGSSGRCIDLRAPVYTARSATPTSQQIVAREQRGNVVLSVVLRSGMKFEETRTPAQMRAVVAASKQQKVCYFERSQAIPAPLPQVLLRTGL